MTRTDPTKYYVVTVNDAGEFTRIRSLDHKNAAVPMTAYDLAKNPKIAAAKYRNATGAALLRDNVVLRAWGTMIGHLEQIDGKHYVKGSREQIAFARNPYAHIDGIRARDI